MKDKIMKFLAYDGKISVVCASTTEFVIVTLFPMVIRCPKQ